MRALQYASYHDPYEGRPQLGQRNPARRYVETLSRYWLIALIPVLVLPIAGAVLALKAKPNASAVANVWISQTSRNELAFITPYTTPATDGAGELRQLLRTVSFDLAVAGRSPRYWAKAAREPSRGVWILQDLSKNVQVVAVGSNLVSISYSNKEATDASQVVGAVVSVAQQRIQHLYQKQSAAGVAFYSRQLSQAQTRLQHAAGSLATYMTRNHIGSNQIATESLIDTRFAGLFGSVQSAQSDVQRFKVALAQAQPAGGLGSPLFVIDPPTIVPVKLSKKTLVLDAAIGLVTALILGGVFVVLITARDDTFRHPDDVVSVLGLPVLASFPLVERVAGLAPGPRVLRLEES